MATRRDGVQPAAERAYEYTKARVLDGRISPGEWIAEGDVADALGISRTPVREAFLHLKGEGLLQLHPRRGAIVVAMTPRDVDAVMELRELVETFAARKAIAGAEGDRRRLVARLRSLVGEQQRAIEAGETARFVEADRAMHAAIVGAGDNDLVDELYTSLRDKQQRVGIGGVARDPERSSSILDEHGQLIDQLEAGDLVGYERTLRHHLDSSRQALGRS